MLFHSFKFLIINLANQIQSCLYDLIMPCSLFTTGDKDDEDHPQYVEPLVIPGHDFLVKL